MKCIDRIFSDENCRSYANACLDMAVKMPEVWVKKYFDTLVIPSRGAVPFFLGMTYALQNLQQFGSEHTRFCKALAVPDILNPMLHPNVKFSNSLQDQPLRVLLVPFTADLNVERFDPTQDNDEYVKKTRGYWARFTAAMFQNPRERHLNPYFQSYVGTILEGIERRNETAQMYRDFPAIGSFAMIDTVISGRASNDILRAFNGIAAEKHNHAINPLAFLVVDEDGRKLKAPFKKYLDYLKSLRQVYDFKVSRIVSEDEGPSLLGIAAVVYPSLMRESKKLEAMNREFFVGAGSWHSAEALEDKFYSRTFSGFMDVVYRYIDHAFHSQYGEQCADSMHSLAEQARRGFVMNLLEDRASRAQLEERSLPCNIYSDYNPPEVYWTNSGVCHVPLTLQGTRDCLSKFLALNAVVQKTAKK